MDHITHDEPKHSRVVVPGRRTDHGQHCTLVAAKITAVAG